ncbi:MAG TPA: hypothetical protein VII01_00310 [Solirubrobacteraceae bacterium]
MTSRRGAQLLAAGRAALGVAVLAAPEPVTPRLWRACTSLTGSLTPERGLQARLG